MKLTLNDQHEIEAQPGQTLLEAAMQAGFFLPHSCRTGRCRSCLLTIDSGDTKATLPELVLTDADRAAGRVLSCCRVPMSDEVRVSGARILTVPLPPEVTSPTRISEIRAIAPDVLGVTLRLPPKLTFDFLPGQYVQLRKGSGPMRSYSLANAPRADRQLELIIGRVPDGAMSRYWFEEAKPNDLLTLQGPKGAFVLEDLAGQPVVMVATGTGIAPIRALLEQIAGQDPAARPGPITLVWGVREAADLHWDPRDLGVVTAFIPVLSRDSGTPEALGAPCRRGYVQEVVAQDRLVASTDQVFACGSEAMLEALQDTVLRMGLPPAAFHADYFVATT